MCHLCHLSTTFNLRSGSARRTSAILKGCLKQGYRVSLIIGRDYDVQEKDLPGVDIFIVPELVKYVSPGLDAVVPLKIRYLLNQLKPDLVHTHLAKAGIVGRLAARSAGVPHIFHTVHGPTFPLHFSPLKRRIFHVLEKLCGRCTDQFIFVGHELQREYIEAGVCSFRKSAVIQTGRPDAVFDRPHLPEAEKVKLRIQLCEKEPPTALIVSVGRLVPSKQLEHAIQITKALHKQNVPAHLVIVGKCLLAEERQYEEKLVALARECGVQNYVHFAGFRDDILNIMEAADAVLLTSRYEGLPNVAVEAVISGTPMVSYNVSGVREILREDVSGYIIEQGDMDLAAEKLIDIVHRPSTRRNERKLCDDKVFNNFRESVMVARKIQMYRQCLELQQ